MEYKNIKYYILFYLLIIPLTLLSQDNNLNSKNDTLNWNNPDAFHNDSLYINNQIKSDQFYDSLTSIASKNKITKTALKLLLVNQPSSGRYMGIEDIRNEEYFNLYKGKTIRNIEIVKLDVFGPSLKDTSSASKHWLDNLGNNTHIKTREFIIKNNLIFDSGDTINPVLLADNERLLRELNFIKDASIQIAEIPENPNYVDILVTTKDVYSAGFYVDLFNLESGAIELYENNLAGIGHKIQAGLLIDTREDPIAGYEFYHYINNIGGSFLSSKIQYKKAFDTETYGFELNRNFFTYSTEWAGGIKFYRTSTLNDIKKTDTTLIDERLNFSTQDFWIGRSFLLKTNNWQYQNKTRLVLAVRYINNFFYEGPEVSEKYNFQFHDNKILLSSISFSRQKFYKSNLIYGFGKTEDIPIGCLVQLTAGFEEDEFFKRPYWGLSLSKGIYYPKLGYLNAHAEFGFFFDGQLEQGVVNITGQTISNLHYYNRIKFREFLSVNFTRGINRFVDEKIYINSSDIWGFPDDKVLGLQKLSFHSELITYSNLHVYNFKFLFFGFGDLAFVGPENRSVFSNKLYYGCGLGLRIRNENLVFKTVQIKFAFYPTVPEDTEQYYFQGSGENYTQPLKFEPTAPSIVEYN